MSGLSLLSEYRSDTESEDDSNPPRGDSGLSEDSRKTRLPVPSLLTERSDNIEHVDDPQQHSGRVRSFPHERGNWVTYVHIPFSPEKRLFCFINLILKNCSGVAEFDVVDDFHISLSRTVILKYHWIQSFTSSLKDIVNNLSSFDIKFTSLNVYTNEECTRTFIGLKVDNRYSNNLKDIVAKVDKLLLEFNLNVFYKDPSFHVSLVWCLGDKKEELAEIVSVLRFVLDDITQESESFTHLHVNQICCKSGNKLYSYRLND